MSVLDVNAPAQPPAPRTTVQKIRRRVLLPLGLLLAAVIVCCNSDYIPSGSMEPTLWPGDHILTERGWVAYPFGAMPSRGDVITFWFTDTDQALDSIANGQANAATEGGGAGAHGGSKSPEVLIKRVIGLPGDTVQIINDVVYINGRRLDEHYSTKPAGRSGYMTFPFASAVPYQVPPGHLFVLGDNRGNSDDSRYWGALDRSQVIGKYVCTLFHQKIDAKEEMSAPSSP